MAKKEKAQRKKKGGKAKWIVLAIVVVIIFAAIAGGGDDSKKENTELDIQPQDSQQEDDTAKMQQLLTLIETGLTNKYDGHTISNDSTTITVNVWKESFTTAADLVLGQNGGADDEGWAWVRSNAENTVVYAADCIRTSDFASTKLLFNVYADENQSRTLLTFDNSGVVYDIVAATPAPTEPATQPAAESQPASTGQSSRNENSGTNSSGAQQTTASYILNIDSMVFHSRSCHVAERILDENRSDYNGTRSDVLSMGYRPCGVCDP